MIRKQTFARIVASIDEAMGANEDTLDAIGCSRLLHCRRREYLEQEGPAAKGMLIIKKNR